MAQQITTTTISDGPRNAVVHIFIKGDGTGDLENFEVIDPALFDPPLPSVPSLRISELWYDLAGFSAYWQFDYLASDTPVWAMSEGNGQQLNFDRIGGLADRSNELDGSGKLMLTTRGLDADGFGSIVVFVKKH